MVFQGPAVAELEGNVSFLWSFFGSVLGMPLGFNLDHFLVHFRSILGGKTPLKNDAKTGTVF